MLLSPLNNPPRTIDELLDPALSASLDRLDIQSRRVFAGTLPGQRRSKRRGKSVEFDDFRQYTPGDDLRHIDWNVFARLDRLVLKLFRAEEDLCLFLGVDVSGSMLSGTPGYTSVAGKANTDSGHKLLYATRLAMALAYLGLVNQNRVSVATLGGADGVKVLAPTRGRAGVHRVGEFWLTQLAAAGKNPVPGDLNSDLAKLARTRQGRGVMLILSDFLSPVSLVPGLNALAAGAAESYDVTCIQLLTDAELDPSVARDAGLSGDLALQPAEGGQAIDVTVAAPTIADYRKRLRQSIDRFHTDATARGIAHLLVPTSTPPSEILLKELRRRGTLA